MRPSPQRQIARRPGGCGLSSPGIFGSPDEPKRDLLSLDATLYDKLSFNFIRDIAPVASIIRQPLVILVNPSVPAKTVPEFIAYAKANPGKINMASSGIGSANPLSGEMFKAMTGVDMIHIPYRADVFSDLISVKARFADLGAAVLAGTPADFGKLLAEETEKCAKVVKFAGIKAE